MSNHHTNDGGKPVFQPKNPTIKNRTPILDELIGQQLRMLREERGLSQNDFARMIGVTYQQVQKYETAQNRIAASTLLLVSVETGESMEYFVKRARKHLTSIK